MTRASVIALATALLVAVAAAGCGGAAAPRAGCRVHGALPDRRCTPGAVDPAVRAQGTRRTVCSAAWAATASRAPVPAAVWRRVLARYPAAAARPARYLPDRLIPPVLGGAAADVRNVWPLPRAAPLGAPQKRQVTAYLRRSVCSGAMSLAAAQTAMRRDWLAEYLDTVTG